VYFMRRKPFGTDRGANCFSVLSRLRLIETLCGALRAE
jgi:hypothetical protein